MNVERLHLKDFYEFLGENGKDATVDIYLPAVITEMKRENTKRPSIVVCPGGGYSFCSQREAEVIAVQYIAKGYNAFVLNYSCAPYRFPSQILEVAATVDLIHKNSDEWNCDLSKVVIIGFSAGGHLAGHYSTSYNCEEVREYFPDSYPVNASILCYPVISAKKEIAHIGSFQNLTGIYKSELPPDDTLKFSLEKRVTKDTPPTYIWHTAEDTCVPVYNSLVYANALASNGIPFELHIFPFGYHGLSTADSQTCDNISDRVKSNNDWISESIKWLDTILK